MFSFQKLFLFFFIFLCSQHLMIGQVKLPSLVGDHMVLQQKAKVNLWGWASPEEEITVLLGWQKEIVKTSADSGGNWKVSVETPAADNQSHNIVVKGKNTIVLRDIVLGEVWVCSGQSNMYFPVGQEKGTWKTGVKNYQKEVANAGNPGIRLFTVGLDVSQTPSNDVVGKWQVCSPETVYNFSAVAYFFGRNLYRELDVPIGLISSSWGSTPAEAWTSQETLEADPDFLPILQRYAKKEKRYFEELEEYFFSLESEFTTTISKEEKEMKIPSKGSPNKNPYVLYNAMLHPLKNYTIKGVIWYQGESNAERAYQYRSLFPAMIQDWRKTWQQGDFPFYFVQITPHHSQNPEIREAQLLSYKTVKNTGIVITTDVGNPQNIHPIDKQTVASRLSLWALANTYGLENIVFSGPLFKYAEKKGNKIIIHFNYTGTGLKVKGEQLKDFQIAGNDRNFYPAEARINGEVIVVTSSQVKNPVAVRYGWRAIPDLNLFNQEGLPASPFRTDDWPEKTYKKK